MDEFDLNDLRAFGLIASAGGLSAAARRFGQAKATLSRSLSRLEAAAGAPLFDRVNRGLRLTPLGTSLLPTAEAAVALMLEADEALRAVQQDPQGPLRIAASALASQMLLAPVIGRLAETHPEVNTMLRVISEGPNPIAEGLDIVIRVDQPVETYLDSRQIVSSALALYTSRSRVSDIDLDDAAAVERLGRITIGAAGVPERWTLRNDEGQDVHMTSEPLITVGDPTIVFGILKTGPGVAFLPQFYAESLTHSGDLVRALPGFRGPAIVLYASLPPRRSSVPAVRIFLDMLTDYVSEIEDVFGPFDGALE